MHMFSAEKKFYGGHGIVGAQVPLGTGLAFAHKYKKDGKCAMVYLGDGAVNQGQVYEAFNMAALWKLPAIYVIENNKYAMGTSVQRSAAGTKLCDRGTAYGIPGEQVDGMDVAAVRAAAAKALARARDGEGPTILEMMTYRYRGHSMSDPAKYRTKEEVAKMRQEHDPIDRLRERLLSEKHIDENGLKNLDREVKDLVSQATEFAQASPEPDPAELYTDVLVPTESTRAKA
jgi:pyruvate dehydrogenase E1 component alpha subunit